MRSGFEKKVKLHGWPKTATAGAGVGLFAFVLYLLTLAPTILYYDLPYMRDAAVLQVKAAVLGIPDFTGYPTFVMLSHLFTYLPVGDIAYRANLATATYAALSVALVFFIGVKLSGRVVAAAVGAVAFAVGGTFWSQAIVAEVYTLNALFVSLTIFTLLVWRERRSDRWLILAAFLMGFSMTDHLTSGLLIPGGFLFVFMVDRRKLVEWKLVLKGAGAFFLGLLPYAFLPIRASMDYVPKGFTWGQPLVREYPPNTLKGFYYLVSGGQWKERMWAFGPADMPDRLGYYVGHLMEQFPFVLLLAAAVGAWYLLFEDRTAAVLLGFLYLGWLFYDLEYDIEDIHFYFIPTYLIVAVFVTIGVGAIFDAADGVLERFRPRLGSRAVAPVLAVFFLALPLLGIADTFRSVDRSDDYRGREMIQAVVNKVKPNSSVLHHRGPLNYMILVEKRRQDIHLINYIEDTEPPTIMKVMKAIEKGPVYILFPGPDDTSYFLGPDGAKDYYGEYGYRLVPVDKELLLYQIVKSDHRLQGGRA